MLVLSLQIMYTVITKYLLKVHTQISVKFITYSNIYSKSNYCNAVGINNLSILTDCL